MKYKIAKTLWVILSRLPLCIIHGLSRLCYFVLYYIVGYRKRIVRHNIATAFPQKNEKDRKKIEKRFFIYLCDTFLESIKLSHWSENQMRRHMEFKNSEEISSLIREGKSVTLFLGHYGNWEWISSMKIWLEGEFAGGQIYKRLHSEVFDKLMIDNRSMFGVECIEMKNTLRHIIDCQRQGMTSVTGYIADQSPSKAESRYFVPFLNKQVPVLTGAERITKRFGFEAYYVDVRRIKRGYWQAEFIRMHECPKALNDYQLTEIFYKYLTKTIERQPEFYLWSHNRFKNAKD